MKIRMIPKFPLMLFISSIFIINFPVMAEVPPGPMNLSSKQKACLEEYSESKKPNPEEMEKLFELCEIEAPPHKKTFEAGLKPENKSEGENIEDCDCEEDSLVVKNSKQIERLLEKIENLEEENQRLARDRDKTDDKTKRRSRRDREDEDDEDRSKRKSSYAKNRNQKNNSDMLDQIYLAYRGQSSLVNVDQNNYPMNMQNSYYNPNNPYAYGMTDLMGGAMGTQIGMSNMSMNSSLGMSANMGVNLGMSGSMGYSSMPNYSMMNYGNFSNYPSYYNYPNNAYTSGSMNLGLGASFGLGIGTGMGYSNYAY